MIAFIGVRISWLMLARNSPFAADADSAFFRSFSSSPTRLREVLGRLPERLVGLLALGDVAGNRVNDAPIRRRCGGPVEPPIRAIARAIAVLEVDHASAGSQRATSRRPLAARSSGCTKSRKGATCSSSLVKPSTCVHAGFSLRKYPSRLATHRRSGDRLKNASSSSAAHFPAAIQADLAAGRPHRFEQRRIGLSNVAAEELHHADDVGPAEERERERAVQPDAFGGDRARKVAVDDDVWDPGGVSARPDTPRQTHAASQRRLPAQLDELGESVGWTGPRADRWSAVPGPSTSQSPPYSQPSASHTARSMRGAASASVSDPASARAIWRTIAAYRGSLSDVTVTGTL